MIVTSGTSPLSLEEIAELMAEYSVTPIIRGIVDRGQFSFGDGGGGLYTRKEPEKLVSFVLMGIMNPYTSQTCQYELSIDEFIDLMKDLRGRKIEEIKTADEWKDRRDEVHTVEALYNELIEYLRNYTERIRKLEAELFKRET